MQMMYKLAYSPLFNQKHGMLPRWATVERHCTYNMVVGEIEFHELCKNFAIYTGIGTLMLVCSRPKHQILAVALFLYMGR